MSKFKRGTFVVDTRVVTILSICLDETQCKVVAGPGVLMMTEPQMGFGTDSNHDRIATPEEIQKIIAGRDYPQWVIDILCNKPGIQKEYITLPPGVNVYNPAPIPMPQIDTTATLKTFQEQCNHHWLDYVGFTKVYQFCKHCDKKKDLTKQQS